MFRPRCGNCGRDSSLGGLDLGIVSVNRRRRWDRIPDKYKIAAMIYLTPILFPVYGAYAIYHYTYLESDRHADRVRSRFGESKSAAFSGLAAPHPSFYLVNIITHSCFRHPLSLAILHISENVECLAYVVVMFFTFPSWVREYYRSTNTHKDKQRQKELERNATPPKVEQRKRALSVSGNLSKDQRVKNQNQSLLWKLPTELRLQIYQAVIGHRQRIHVAYVKGQVVSYRCQRTSNLPLHNQCWCHCRINPQGSAHLELRHMDNARMDVLDLLQTCRLMCVYVSYFLQHMHRKHRSCTG